MPAARSGPAARRLRVLVVEDEVMVALGLEGMLADLGHKDAPAPSRSKGGRPRGYVMSDETKAKLRAAWKQRHGDGAQASKSVVHALDAEAKGRRAGSRRTKIARGANR